MGKIKNKILELFRMTHILQKKGSMPTKRFQQKTPVRQIGTIVILLDGKFAGKRAVLLSNRKNGNVLVAGPSSVNGVGLTFIESIKVLGTSVVLDISKVGFDFETINFNDIRISREERRKNWHDSDREFMAEVKNTVDTDKVKELNDKVNSVLVGEIKKQELLEEYLKDKFGLKAEDKFHAMKF
eukprot:GAHX01000615.1.p1 GENE.GAHX01000615.1~~GAHX01000615.1.p1  ORF type:complete len:184 (-),score=37.24 GAHX01000615.1:34-585(-)